jgi:hypothetical protein
MNRTLTSFAGDTSTESLGGFLGPGIRHAVFSFGGGLAIPHDLSKKIKLP